MFARAVNENETIKSVLDDVILVQMDCEKGEGPEIAKKYNVRGYPTFLTTNAQGEVTGGLLGYPGPDKWTDWVKTENKDQRTIAEKKTAFAAGATKELACSLATHASVAYDFAGAVKYYQTARDLDPDNAAQYSEEILTFMYYGSRGGDFTLDQIETEAQVVTSAPGATADTHVMVTQMLGGLAKQNGQPERVIPYLKKALKATEGNEEMAEARLQLEIGEALLITKDADKAFALKKQTMDEGWHENAEQLNEFAWWCFENDVNLAQAEEMALKAVELAEDDSQRANILDTAAEICNARGNCDQAIARIKQAIALDPDKSYFKDQLARFEKAQADKDS